MGVPGWFVKSVVERMIAVREKGGSAGELYVAEHATVALTAWGFSPTVQEDGFYFWGVIAGIPIRSTGVFTREEILQEIVVLDSRVGSGSP